MNQHNKNNINFVHNLSNYKKVISLRSNNFFALPIQNNNWK